MTGFLAPADDLIPRSTGRTMFGDPLPGSTPIGARRAQTLGEEVIGALQASSTGLALRRGLPDIAPNEEAPWYHRLARNVAGIAGDVPAMVGGAVAGGVAGSAAPVVGTAIGAAAGSFAAPMAIREALMEAYNNDHAASWAGVWEIAKAAMKGGAKGAVIGAATAGAGQVVGRAVLGAGVSRGMTAEAAALAVAGNRGKSLAAMAAAELTTLTTTSAALEGHLPTWQDFADNAILLGGMKASVHVAKNLRNIYRATGKTPAEVTADVRKDPNLALDLKPVEPPVTAEPMVEAWHGGKVAFDKFSLDYPNSGAGSQTHGRGAYLGEAKGTGVTYAGGFKFVNGKGEIVDLPQKMQSYAATAGDGIQLAIDAAKRIGDADVVRFFEAFAAEGGRVVQAGNLYRVQIPRRIVDMMIDEDLPISQQPPAVQAAWRAGLSARGLSPELDIAEVLHLIKRDSELTSALESAGIKGVKYLDEQSRGEGAGTRNFVVFDPNDITIIERNGVRVGGAAPAVPPEIPSAYRPLALEESVKAAIGDPRTEVVKRLLTGEDTSAVMETAVKWDYVADGASMRWVLNEVTNRWTAEIEAQRRGKVPNAESMAQAKAIIEAGSTKPHEIGAAENSAQVVVRAAIVRDALNNIERARQEWLNTPAHERTAAHDLAVQAAIETLGRVNAEFAGVRAEAGRALQIFQTMKRDAAYLKDAEFLLASLERKASTADIVAMLGDMKNDPARAQAFLKGVQNATTFEKVFEAWKAGILSGTQTLLANPLGNIGKWVVDLPEAVLSASIFALDRAAVGDPIKFAQWKARALAPILGWQYGARDGLLLAKEAFASGVNDKTELYKPSIGGKTGEVVRLPFKILAAQDAVFRVPAERAKAYVSAVDRVVAEGLHPETREGQALTMKYLTDPTFGLKDSAAKKVLAAIEQAGSEAVFAQRLGPLLETVQMAMHRHAPALGFIVPFIRTPANLVSWAVQHVPAMNFMSARWRADFFHGTPEARAMAITRVLVGTGLALTAYQLAQEGVITGGGLFEKEQAGAKRGAGWQPYSIKIDGTYYSFQRLEPVAKVLGIAADLVEMAANTKEDDDAAKTLGMLVLLFGNATVSTTYLSGLSNVIQGTTDPARYGTALAEQFASSLVPKIIGQTTMLFDPHKREVDGAIDAIQAQIPVLRQMLMPKRDVWGEEAPNSRLFESIPIVKSKEATEKVRTEAMRLQLAIAEAPRYVVEKGPFNPKDKRIDFTAEQRDIMAQVTGKQAMAILSPIVNHQDWERTPDFVKIMIYKKVFERTRKEGQYAALPPEDAARAKIREKLVEEMMRQTRGVAQ